jgi:hypothetical protein
LLTSGSSPALFFSRHQTILQLHDELNAARENSSDPSVRATWQQTSLKPHIEYFKEFVTKLMNASRAENPRSYAKQAGTNAEKEVGTWRAHLTARVSASAVDTRMLTVLIIVVLPSCVSEIADWNV